MHKQTQGTYSKWGNGVSFRLWVAQRLRRCDTVTNDERLPAAEVLYMAALKGRAPGHLELGLGVGSDDAPHRLKPRDAIRT